MDSFLEVAQEIARETGALLAGYFARRIGYRLKGEFDLVTEADLASEKLVVERLRARFPSHGIVAEEGGGHQGASEYRWYVDPLDGTVNFAHGFPVFCVSLGLGARRRADRRSSFRSRARRDVQCRARLRSSPQQPPHPGLQGRSPDRKPGGHGLPEPQRHLDVNVHFFYQLAMQTHGVRRAGSAALDLAYVASGRLDAFWEFGLNPWDMAAGALLVTEAGGALTDMHGGTHTLTGPHILADNGLIHDEALQHFREVFAGEYRTPLPTA